MTGCDDSSFTLCGGRVYASRVVSFRLLSSVLLTLQVLAASFVYLSLLLCGTLYNRFYFNALLVIYKWHGQRARRRHVTASDVSRRRRVRQLGFVPQSPRGSKLDKQTTKTAPTTRWQRQHQQPVVPLSLALRPRRTTCPNLLPPRSHHQLRQGSLQTTSTSTAPAPVSQTMLFPVPRPHNSSLSTSTRSLLMLPLRGIPGQSCYESAGSLRAV